MRPVPRTIFGETASQNIDALSKNRQDVALGVEMEKFGTAEAMADDQKVADVYAKKGAKVFDLDEATVEKWRAIARDTAWKDYAQKTRFLPTVGML